MGEFLGRKALNSAFVKTVFFDKIVAENPCARAFLTVYIAMICNIRKVFDAERIARSYHQPLNSADAFDEPYAAVRKVFFDIAFVILSAFGVEKMNSA